MAEANLEVKIEAVDRTAQAIQSAQGNFNRLGQTIAEHRRAIGLAMTAMGAAIAGLAGFAVKAAE